MGIDGAASAQAYTMEHIEVLEGLEPVRRRPGMYVGDTRDGSGLHQLARVLLDHAVDQHAEDRCFRVAVTSHGGGAVTVEDDGPGIPVETAERSLTRLCASGRRWAWSKRDSCGFDLSVANALSEYSWSRAVEAA